MEAIGDRSELEGELGLSAEELQIINSALGIEDNPAEYEAMTAKILRDRK